HGGPADGAVEPARRDARRRIGAPSPLTGTLPRPAHHHHRAATRAVRQPPAPPPSSGTAARHHRREASPMTAMSIYIWFPGTTREALTFYQGVFGGELALHTLADMGRTDG